MPPISHRTIVGGAGANDVEEVLVLIAPFEQISKSIWLSLKALTSAGMCSGFASPNLCLQKSTHNLNTLIAEKLQNIISLLIRYFLITLNNETRNGDLKLV